MLWEFEGPWDRIAKFLNTALSAYTWSFVRFVGWELEGCNCPLRFLFVEWLLMALCRNRALQKNNFSGSENLFFRTCLDCFQSTQSLYVDRTGSFLRDVIVKGRRKETKKTTYWPYWQTREVAQNKPPPQFELTTFRREDRRSNHCATGPLPPEDFAFLLSLWVGCKGLGFGLGCGCEKTIFRELKNYFFGTALVSPGNHFSGPENLFYRIPAWKMKWNEPFLRGLQGSSQALRFFSRPETLFYRHCPCETHWHPAL